MKRILFNINKKFWCGSEIFLTVVILGTLIAVSRRSWIIVWLGLELNIVGFLGWICISSGRNYRVIRMWGADDEISVFPPNIEPFAKYFLVQSVGSAFFLIFPLVYGISFIRGLAVFFLLFGLFIKRGIAPFHQWFPSVCSNVSWKINMVLIFWQKVGPIFIIVGALFSSSITRLIIFSILNLFFGVFGAMGQTQLRSLFAYSSIAHIGWMVAIIYFSKLGFFYYFILYRVMIVSLTLVFRYMKVYRLKSIKGMAGYVDYMLIRLVLILRVGGVPPFTGFFIKVYSLYLIMWDGWAILAVIFCVFATMRLSYYINVVFSSLLFCVFPKVSAVFKSSLNLGAISGINLLCSLMGIFRGLGLCLVRGVIF